MHGQACFLTFSCYKRRRILDEPEPCRIVIEVLASQLAMQEGKCQGFVIMPDHVHALVWFAQPGQLSHFMKQWKQRSSIKIKRNLGECRKEYVGKIGLGDPIWQPGYFNFDVYSDDKIRDKLNYMHNNPVKAGLVATPEEWIFSSARFYGSGKDVGVPITQPG